MRASPMAICSALARHLLLVFLVLYQLSCATYSQQAVSMRDNLLVGRVDLAKKTAEQQDENQDDVLACLNKGILRRMTQDYAGSNQILEAAKQQIDSLYGLSISETATSLTFNDALRDYKGARYEQILLHAYMAMNYLQLGDVDSARVEILQADVKMMEWGEQPDENPFVRYFAGMIFEAVGEYDQALVAYRKARDGYLASRSGAMLEVPLVLKKDLLRLLAMQGLTNEYRRLTAELGLTDYQPASIDDNVGEVVVILSSGLAPIRTETAIMTFSSEVQGHVRVAFPVYAQASTPANKARVRIDDKHWYMETVENVDKLARQALDEDMPLIMARAMARAVVKYQSQRTAQEQNDLAGFLLTVTNLATERADTRSWTTLPKEIQMTRVLLPAGQQHVSIEIVNSAGRVV
ncbi:MAG: hypothetical protein KJP15_06405, partial [Gammaproteobacteria bacterium]|nr:hypothetical protein [Gammaproteobacteria bacterium]